MSKLSKTLIVIIVIILALFIGWLIRVNSPYVADVFACKEEFSTCKQSEANTADVQYDTMDGIYTIHNLHVGDTVVPLKQCITSIDNPYAQCEDENGHTWGIELLEKRWIPFYNFH